MNPVELYKYDLKSSIIRETEAKEWIESVIGEAIGEDLATALNDGIVLCKLSNALLPDSPPIKYAVSALPFKKMDNISKFLKTLPSLGLSSFETFQTVDLFEKKNMNQVIDCLFAISRNAEKNGFQGPLIGNRHLRSRNSMNSTISNSSRHSEPYVNTKLSQCVDAPELQDLPNRDNYEEAGLSVVVETKDSDLDSSNTVVEANHDLGYQNQDPIIDDSTKQDEPLETDMQENKLETENKAVLLSETSIEVEVNGDIVQNKHLPDDLETSKVEEVKAKHVELSIDTTVLKPIHKVIAANVSDFVPPVTTTHTEEAFSTDILQPIPIKSPPNLQMNFAVDEQFEDSPDSLNYVEMLDESKYYQTDDYNCFSPARTIMETIVEESECSTQLTTTEDLNSEAQSEVMDENQLNGISGNEPDPENAVDLNNQLQDTTVNIPQEQETINTDMEQPDDQNNDCIDNLGKVITEKVPDIAVENLSPIPEIESNTESVENLGQDKESNEAAQEPKVLNEYPSKEEIREKILKRQSSALSIFRGPNGNTIIPDSPNDKLTFNPELVFLKLANLGYKQNFYCSNIHTKDTSVENIINVTNAKLQNLGYRF
ncbi:Transgelin-3 [Boothiomyces macroporosus]|uniref:Transgelin-3 n=1 Tax=Boothiomyces macroporosus TaxID=261099 RepID=A0AAD5UFE9_9FUNG|nr:Transgelin-3 [Boothiomyces macroporosus]KAJ3256626.1 Transgelin-3 [Boothiomyces macroporosus]